MHVILKSLIILTFSIGLVSAKDYPFCWRPCPRHIDEIQVIQNGRCYTYPNSCTYKNGIRCGLIGPDAFCRKGICGNDGDLQICHKWDPDA